MPDSRPRRLSPLWAVLSLAFTLALAASILFGGRRVASFYAAANRQTFAFQVSTSREFSHAGRSASLADVPDPAGAGGLAVLLRFGDASVRIPAGVAPGNDQLPGLIRHNDWLRVLRFVDRKGLSLREVESALANGTIDARVVVVARRPVAAPDPRTGESWKRDWTFEFRELLPDGSIREQSLLYPRSRPGRAPKPGQLAEGTWQWDAAMMLTPSTARPNRSFTTDALDAMGWTFPASMLSVLGLIIAATGLAASRLRSRATA